VKQLIDKIKQKGYWKVVIRPQVFKEKYISSIDECKKVVQDSIISLRGWNYPHIDKSRIKISGNDSVESFCDSDFMGIYEYWRYYQSGQFVHYFTMREDYRMDEAKLQQVQDFSSTSSTKFLSILSSLYSVTEIYQFALRLTLKDALGDSIEVIIELHDIEGRELFFWECFSRFLDQSYICKFRDEPLVIERLIKKEELISNADNIALDACVEMFRKFNWENPSKTVLEEDQKKFLQRRL